MTEITHDHRIDEGEVVAPPPPPPPPRVEREREAAVVVVPDRDERAAFGRSAMRMVVAAIGISAMVLGSLLEWTAGRTGIEIPVESFYRTGLATDATFLTSAGAVTIGLGILALIGLAMRGGWLIRIAGALGTAATVLMLVTIGRTDGASIPTDIQLGLWLVLAGSVVTLIAGFIPTTRAVEVPDREVATTER